MKSGRPTYLEDHWTQQYPIQPLREYALLADGERGVVVGPRGEFAWMCAPRWHDPAVMSSLIGGRGLFAVTPVGERWVWGGHYERDSLIWRSRWVTTSSEVECREALARPADPHTAVVLRDIQGKVGTSRLRVVLEPAADFGKHGLADVRRDDSGVWTGCTGELYFRVTGLADAVVDRDALVTEVVVGEGDSRAIVLEVSDQPLPRDAPPPAAAWAETERCWNEDVPGLGHVWAPRDVGHAYAVLQGLTSAGGGMVAAATTSLPERAEKGRNYDYRYVWIRDQAMVGQAIAKVGEHPMLRAATSFVTDRLLADGAGLRPAYDIDGNPLPDEQTLALPGFPGGDDHTGNKAGAQFQLDAFGEALLLFRAVAGYGDLDPDTWKAAEAAVGAIAERWEQPDAGVWEIEPQRWTHSRLICVAGLRGMAELAPRSQADEWARLADRLERAVESECVSPEGRWMRAPGDQRVDGSLLIPVLRGAMPPDDPRTRATVHAVKEELGEDHYLYRFRHTSGPLAAVEGAFLLCGFHMSAALSVLGEDVEAARWFERNRSACGPPGLLTEEFDVVQRQLRGNLPQAFVHGALIEASARLSR
ncbi:MAG TPA: glycoside hydrolase family 15 protein [Marmoricola sp.]|nr:glycoside hydrolase family 15 protein [Marmoricola sp.]